MDFQEQEKIAAFDQLAPCFAERRFGSMTKAEIELIFFSIILNHQKQNQCPTDDYSLSKLLGITQQKVRSLKVKAQLREPTDYKWQEELAQLALHARYTTNDQYVTMSFDNPMLQIEIQHYVEAHDGFVDYTPNPKLLKMQIVDFAALLVSIGLEKDEKGVLELLQKKDLLESSSTATDKETIWQRLKSGTTEMLKDIITATASQVLTNCITGQH